MLASASGKCDFDLRFFLKKLAMTPHENEKTSAWNYLKAFPVSLFGASLLLCTIVFWWQSSRFSERRLVYFGSRSAEIFSSSSLIRVSVVDGFIDPHGRSRGYRQRNVRGRFTIRPLVPHWRIAPSIWEVTLGFWHLALLFFLISALAGFMETRACLRRHRERVEHR